MDDYRRIEVSLITSAMSWSAIVGTCTFTCYQGSRERRRWDRRDGIKERPKGTRVEGKG